MRLQGLIALHKQHIKLSPEPLNSEGRKQNKGLFRFESWGHLKMAELSAAIAAVHDAAAHLDPASDPDACFTSDNSGEKLQRSSLKKKEPLSVEALKNELEQEFLTPSPRFSTEWLNILQKYVGLRTSK